ncbi:hypothetical protein AB3N58_09270 [Leptospira sp. WS60.C2]
MSIFNLIGDLEKIKSFRKSQSKFKELLELFPEKDYKKVWLEINSFKPFLNPSQSEVFLYPTRYFDPFLLSYPLSPILIKPMDIENVSKQEKCNAIVFKRDKSSFMNKFPKWDLLLETDQFLLVTVK